MSSKSKKKDKKKSKSKDEKIELKEMDETAGSGSSLLITPDEMAASSVDLFGLNQKANFKVKILPALDGQDDNIYEEAVAAMLNSPDFDGYELLSVQPSANAGKLIAFFKLSK